MPAIGAHLASHVRADQLDRALAAGATPDDRAALALRARRLTSPTERGRLARGLRALIREARGGRSRTRVPVARVPVARDHVREAEAELALLASRLDGPCTVRPRGVAQARLLLGDGLGPLYNPAGDGDLACAAETAARALRA